MVGMKDLWPKMKDGDEARFLDGTDEGLVAIRETGGLGCPSLRWTNGHKERVQTEDVLNGDWELVNPEPAEMNTEKWMLKETYPGPYFRYGSGKYLPGCVKDMKNFLCWGGEPWPDGVEPWPPQQQVIWINPSGKGGRHWGHAYNKNLGYTKRLVADYALMEVTE